MGYLFDLDKLSVSSDEVDVTSDSEKVKETVEELKYRMSKDNLIALSAPQVGNFIRVFCIKFTTKGKNGTYDKVHTIINPIIVGMKGFVLDREKDVSLHDRQFIIPRNNEINVMFQNERGESVNRVFVGKASFVIQLMIDHLDGVLLSDVGLEIDDRFDEATNEEKEELLSAYADWIGKYKDIVNDEVKKDEELSSISDAVKFIQSVRSGETNLGSPLDIDNSEVINYYKDK